MTYDPLNYDDLRDHQRRTFPAEVASHPDFPATPYLRPTAPGRRLRKVTTYCPEHLLREIHTLKVDHYDFVKLLDEEDAIATATKGEGF